MTGRWRLNAASSVALCILAACAGSAAAQVMQPDSAAIIQRVDAAVKARVDSILDTPSPSTTPFTATTTKSTPWLK